MNQQPRLGFVKSGRIEISGYRPQFGIIGVERKTQQRTPKPRKNGHAKSVTYEAMG
jgi:hypothetical protein